MRPLSDSTLPEHLLLVFTQHGSRAAESSIQVPRLQSLQPALSSLMPGSTSAFPANQLRGQRPAGVESFESTTCRRW